MNITRSFHSVLPLTNKSKNTTNALISSNAALTQATQDMFIGINPIQFGHELEKNHGIHWETGSKEKHDTSGQVIKMLVLKTIEMQGKKDSSSLIYTVDTPHDDKLNWPATHYGNAGAIGLSGVPLDTLVNIRATPKNLLTLEFSKGKRYMNSGAQIVMGPHEGVGYYAYPDVTMMVRAFNQHQRQMEWLILHRAGLTETDGKVTKEAREAVRKDLESYKVLNSLQSLAYGTKGLVDAIIFKKNGVLTREGLNNYYQAYNIVGNDAIEEFNNQHESIDKVLKWAEAESQILTFEQFNPNTLSKNPVPHTAETIAFPHDDTPVNLDDPSSIHVDSVAMRVLKSFKTLTPEVMSRWVAEVNHSSRKSHVTSDEATETEPLFYSNGSQYPETTPGAQLSIKASSCDNDVEIKNIPFRSYAGLVK